MWTRSALRRGLAATACAPLLAACVTKPGPHLGDTLDPTPDWQRIGEAARTAIASPRVWAPAAGALLFRTTGADRDVSDWAREETPVFGSRENAERASDRLRDLAQFGYYITVLFAPGDPDATAQTLDKIGTLAVGTLGVSATHAMTSAAKSGSDRLRPDGSDRRSFPSGHASSAAAYAANGRLALRWLPLEEKAVRALTGAYDASALATGWARVEAGRHYPSDILAGYALGTLIGEFVTLTLLGNVSRITVLTEGLPDEKAFVLRIHFAFP